MTSRDFCYWLQGYFEILGAANPTEARQALTAEQTEMIGRHLNLVFVHEIDPSINQGDKAKADLLNALHAWSQPPSGAPIPPDWLPRPPSFTQPDKHPIPAPPFPQTPLRC